MTTLDDDGDGLLSRADLEIELARLVLAVERRRPGEDADPDAHGAFALWFEQLGADLIGRIAPDLRPFCLERLQQIAVTNGGLELSRLDVPPDALAFTPTAADEGPSPPPEAMVPSWHRPQAPDGP